MTYLPINLYRLQLNHRFTFSDAIRILPYLKELGIDTLYCSPIFQAVQGSMHGYDLVNPLIINHELGGEEGFKAFRQQATALGFGIILDVVANHMAASLQNPWWRDVLTHGAASRYADYFDINWSSPLQQLKGKVLIPVLDLTLPEALRQGRIQLLHGEGKRGISAMGEVFPLNPTSEEQLTLNPSQSIEEVLDQQYYLLDFWQTASHSINYRRFFDINSLIALKMEQRECFDHFHQLAIHLYQQGDVQGFRIDHPDGFYEPYHYFLSLHQACKEKSYIVIEKILERDESIPDKWPVQGSVGYEYLNTLNQVFVDPKGEKVLTDLYNNLMEETKSNLINDKRSFVSQYLLSEIHFMISKLNIFTAAKLEEAIIELYAMFPVYRTYLEKTSPRMSDVDKGVLLEAFDKALLSKPSLEPVFEYLREVFFRTRDLTEEETLLIMRFQQIAPAVMAKGFEDTYLYHYNRLISLNEVGSWPHHFGEDPSFFHEKIQEKQKKHPQGWMTLSTHDTKRSYEMRMRLHVISECALEWKTQVETWHQENASYKQGGFPDANHEYFLYQALVGFWPDKAVSKKEKEKLIERVKAYLLKAARESKAYTNWMHHHTAYENALMAFIEAILQDNTPFFTSLRQWVSKISKAGQRNSLAGVNLALFLPASFDLYQGTELMDFSFVDPDNRRLVDYDLRETLLQKILKEKVAPKDLSTWKIYMLHKGLHIRKKLHSFIVEGEYLPLEIEGSSQKRVIAYVRILQQGRRLVVISGLLLFEYKNASFWKETLLKVPKGWKEGVFIELYTGLRIVIKDHMSVDQLLPLVPFGAFIEEEREELKV